jgi:hypothetical protein
MDLVPRRLITPRAVVNEQGSRYVNTSGLKSSQRKALGSLADSPWLLRTASLSDGYFHVGRIRDLEMMLRILAWPTAQNVMRRIRPPAGPLMVPGPEKTIASIYDLHVSDRTQRPSLPIHIVFLG